MRRPVHAALMSKLRCHISISADGLVAGPNQSAEEPLGEGGERLHDWVVGLDAWHEAHDKEGGEHNASTQVMKETLENVGAGIMGRGMFGPIGGGPWDDEWKGWWGDDPPFHYDVFVVTHHPREPVEMAGGTTYHFVTEGIERALALAKDAAGGRDVMLWGGGEVIQQYLAAGLLDELELHVTPILLGGGSRVFGDLGHANITLEQLRAVEAPGVTHIKYGVQRAWPPAGFIAEAELVLSATEDEEEITSRVADRLSARLSSGYRLPPELTRPSPARSPCAVPGLH